MKVVRVQILNVPWASAYEDLGEYTDRYKMQKTERHISSRPVWMDVLQKLLNDEKR